MEMRCGISSLGQMPSSCTAPCNFGHWSTKIQFHFLPLGGYLRRGCSVLKKGQYGPSMSR